MVEYREKHYELDFNKNELGKLVMFIKNTKYNVGFKIERDTKTATVIDHYTYSKTLFGSKTKTYKRDVYDEDKVFFELINSGKTIIDFLLEMEKLITIDEKEKAEQIFKTLQYGIKDFKEQE